MKVKNLLPNSSIADYADRILVIENTGIVSPYTLPLYANAVPTILFKSVKGKLGNNNAGHLTLFGQTIMPELLTIPEDFILIAYFFKPYALISLFSVAAHELTDKPIDLNLLFPQKSVALQEKLLNAATVEDMIILLDSFIADLINKSAAACPLIKYATTQMLNNPLKKTLPAIQKELHVTERTFQRMFEKNIGVTPNLYRRICQFNAAFTQLNQRKYRKLSDIAFQNGYADQSHYIRAFKEFTGITPNDYLRFGSEQ